MAKKDFTSGFNISEVMLIINSSDAAKVAEINRRNTIGRNSVNVYSTGKQNNKPPVILFILVCKKARE
ncbi:hypothetical protein bsdcttw_25690 [Anaerocolumna chitinilytica]|uniref:Uncharacterized protein n=1 Tax=Anaerocolumna chitinilytica TaxID=1727145 RepID=A0A7I8DM88_9FIRM|nr:hypothetical protein bsdcttw_25690 [Anaerocolumna chitinilytica]